MNRTSWLLIGLGLTVVLAFAGGGLTYALLYTLGAYNVGDLWPVGATIGAALGIYFSRQFVQKRTHAILPVMNTIISLVILFQAIFWWFAFIPSDTSPAFGFSLLVPLMAVAIISFWKRLAVSPWVISHEAINLMALIIVNFSWWYWSQSAQGVRCMNMGMTRADSVYFTLTTLATVGYGDIHPVSEACREIVTWQILASFLFVAIILVLTVSRVGEATKPATDTQGELNAITQMQKRLEEFGKDLDDLKTSLNEARVVSLKRALKRHARRLGG